MQLQEGEIMATCVICDCKTDNDNLTEVGDCICRVCPECKANIDKGGVDYAEKVAEDKRSLRNVFDNENIQGGV